MPTILPMCLCLLGAHQCSQIQGSIFFGWSWVEPGILVGSLPTWDFLWTWGLALGPLLSLSKAATLQSWLGSSTTINHGVQGRALDTAVQHKVFGVCPVGLLQLPWRNKPPSLQLSMHPPILKIQLWKGFKYPEQQCHGESPSPVWHVSLPEPHPHKDSIASCHWGRRCSTWKSQVWLKQKSWRAQAVSGQRTQNIADCQYCCQGKGQNGEQPWGWNSGSSQQLAPSWQWGTAVSKHSFSGTEPAKMR